MKKLLISTALGMIVIAPLALLSGAANAEREVIRVERPADNNGVGEGVQQGVVEHPVADAEAVRIARENADDDNDGITNVNDPDDNNDGVPDDTEGASSSEGAQ